jgi:hypothetical protein
MDKPSLTPGARGAAEAYCDRNFPSISWSYATRRISEEAFRAGVEWALSPPTPEEIEAAFREYWCDRPPRDDDGYLHSIVGNALRSLLEGRKR